MAEHIFLGLDIGSSSVKASLLNAESGENISSAQSPEEEMPIDAPKEGWAEQLPQLWWEHTINAVHKLLQMTLVRGSEIAGIGISYQMHGLVAVDKDLQPVRPSIIWCDSRAVDIGNNAFEAIGKEYCLNNLLNSPGNFTASKLKWVKENEPWVYSKIHKVLLPGDYIALQLTGELNTTITGLSEGIFWDYRQNGVSDNLLKYYGINPEMIADVTGVFQRQGALTAAAAESLGLKEGIPVAYRAGDQPNNAFSLNALSPGETAATAGTSGVIYAVVDEPVSDTLGRVNTFVHVNHKKDQPRYGVLLCINGTGIMNSWIRQLTSEGMFTYKEMNLQAKVIPVGSEGVKVFPFGNGAERMFGNRTPGSSIAGIDLNRHKKSHLYRAVQEGIVFGLNYGLQILKEIGIEPDVIRAGRANMFLSEVFCEAFVNTTGIPLQVYNTDGALGAARGAALGAGFYSNESEAFDTIRKEKEYAPRHKKIESYGEAYQEWVEILENQNFK